MNNIINAKNLDRALKTQALKSVGLEEVYAQLLALKHRGLISEAMYFRKKKEYKELCTTEEQEDDTIAEINHLIKDVYDNLM